MPSARLVELFAHGVGVIDDARIEFGAGFNVLTGETGAGKTLLLGALELCLGGEGASSRHAVLGDMRAAAVFERPDATEVALARESGSSGRLRSSLNGAPSSAEALRATAQSLIVIHGQHDSLSLRNRGDVLAILDASGGVVTTELDDVRRRRREVDAERARYGGDEAQRQREVEFLDFQVAEIEGATIRGDEELSEVIAELGRLSDLRDGQAALATALEELDGDLEGAVLARFAQVVGGLPVGAAFDTAREALRDALAQSREAVRDLASLRDAEDVDDARLASLELRATRLQTLVRKYGGSLAAVREALEEMRVRQSFLRRAAERLAQLDVEQRDLIARERELARTVRRERERAAVALTNAVRTQLPRVALANATLRFEVDGDDGGDARILFTPNPGLPEGPLDALASGGELSRVLLALSLETVHAEVVAVFDEIDAGVGGQVAQQIGDCLRELGRQQQVIAVTHLASVAAKADHHFVIEKSVRAGSTHTEVRALSGEERVREVARMLAGAQVTDESRALAAQLLETSI